MASKVAFTIFSIIFGAILVAANGISHEINTCANHAMECNPKLSDPCCDSNSTCKLINNVFKTDKVRFFCYKTIQIGGSCEEDDFDCTGDCFARCSSKNVCECDNPQERNGPICSPTLNAYCEENEHCKVENSFCWNGFCTCKGHFRPNRKMTECLPEYL